MSASYITGHTFPNVKTTTFHSRPCLKILKSEPTYMDALLTDIVNQIADPILDHFKKTNDQTLQISFAKQLELVTNSEEFKTQSTTSARQTGLNPQEQDRCFQKVMEFARTHFIDFPSEFKREDENMRILLLILNRARVNMKLSWGAKTIEPSFSLTEDDYNFLGIPNNYKMTTPQRLDCAGYFFLRTRETRARDWIVGATNREEHSDYIAFFTRTFEILKEWGYMQITQPVENDMVLYLEMGETTHVGLFTSANRVISKLGLKAFGITDHEIHHVPIEFGHQIMFFRKCIQEGRLLHSIRDLELD